MQKTVIIYPAILMMALAIFLYIKSYFDNIRALKNNNIKGSYFKAYKGDVPDYIEVSRQTLKNQFELPIFFYFLICLLLIFDHITIIDLILAWIFVISRYIHCFIRLTSNHIPYRANIFQIGFFILMVWWLYFLYNIL